MKKVLGIFALAFAAPSGLLYAFAQNAPFPPPGGGFQGGRMLQMPAFADMDKNGDRKISRDEFAGPAQFFDRLDEDKDGFVDEDEWNRVRGRMGGGGRAGETLGRSLDADRDGKVSRQEFGIILQVFDRLDSDGDGGLTTEELNRFFQVLGELRAQATGGVDVDNLFERFDKNKDGKIAADEMNSERQFKALDLNKDGFIGREEAETALKQLAERSRQRQ